MEDAAGDEDRRGRGGAVNAPSRLLVRAPNWLGDVMLSLGAVRDLRRNFASARIEVLARPSVADVYKAVCEIDGLRLCPSFGEGVAAARGFEAALLLPNSFGSALQVWRAGIPERWGYARDGRSLLLTRRARVPRAVLGFSEAYYYRALLAELGLAVSSELDLSLACLPEWRERGQTLLRDADERIGLNPGAAFGSAKRWLPERYAAVADALAESRSAQVVILGSNTERALAETIAATMRHPARILCGETSLPELIGVLASLRLLVTNDSGPMHVAAALGVPVVAIFGPTDWRETAPRGQHCRVVREGAECAPCKLRECPIDHRCMTGVDVARVLATCEDLLATTAAERSAC
jgi:heptosyltransferase-2